MAHLGREFTFDWNSTTLAGVQSRGLTTNNEYIDVTTDDSNGWRTLLATPGLRSVEVTIGGLTEDEVLLSAMFNANANGKSLTGSLPTGSGTVTGTFFVTAYEQSGEHSSELKFSATFSSSGEVTYTASA